MYTRRFITLPSFFLCYQGAAEVVIPLSYRFKQWLGVLRSDGKQGTT